MMDEPKKKGKEYKSKESDEYDEGEYKPKRSETSRQE